MFENMDANGSLGQDNDYSRSCQDYLKKALQACEAGDAVLGMHLYIAAFEQACHVDERYAPSEDAIAGLKQAWALSCRLKERALAEYIFEKLEPYLSAAEVAACAEQLQRLALDKLQEFGLSREELEDMTDMISQDFLGIEGARVVKVEHLGSFDLPLKHKIVAAPESDAPALQAAAQPSLPTALPQAQGSDGAGHDPEPADGEVAALQQSLPEGAKVESIIEGGPEGQADIALVSQPQRAHVNFDPALMFGEAAKQGEGAALSPTEHLTYRDIAGYDSVVEIMRDYGVGMRDDPRFQELVSVLNKRHGLDRMPAADALLFRSPAREDANRFMGATLGELKLPALRMRMEENMQGLPVLCVMAQANNQPKLNAARTAFEGPGVLVIEDLDLWIAPVGDAADDLGGLLAASLSRGAREAISLMRSAVENPDVFVLASAAEACEIDPFFLDLMEPLSIIDIDFPTPAERADIWMELAGKHPSLRALDRAALVRLSTNMPRYDIYMAAREAIEDAYKASLMARRYVAVSLDNLYEKLAAYQPLDSDEYRALENAVVEDFRLQLGSIEDLLEEEGN